MKIDDTALPLSHTQICSYWVLEFMLVVIDSLIGWGCEERILHNWTLYGKYLDTDLQKCV